MLVYGNHFEDVALVITHYNRSNSLNTLLEGFQKLNCSFKEIIVSDDGSNELHHKKLVELQTKYDFQLISTEKNKGLGNNINKAQKNVTATYTLYVQEDFIPKIQFPEIFHKALKIIEDDSKIDIIRFYAYFKYPYLSHYDTDFGLMNFHSEPWYFNHLKFHFYSDHPHLKRSKFYEKFGWYKEGAKGDDTEYSMSISFLKNHAKGLFYKNFNELFDQYNSSQEPSTMLKERADWKLSPNLFIRGLRFLYLIIKFLKCSVEYYWICLNKGNRIR